MKPFFRPCLALVTILGAACAAETSPETNPEEFDWRADWKVEEGFSIDIDTQGYELPTAIAFVPSPGHGPQDPLYFVTELLGTLKLVTNNRTVYTFAEGFLRSDPPFDSQATIAGMAGRV